MPASAVRAAGQHGRRAARRGRPQRRAAARAAGRLPRLPAVRGPRGRRRRDELRLRVPRRGGASSRVTASSLGLVTSVPLARVGLDPAGVARHVDRVVVARARSRSARRPASSRSRAQTLVAAVLGDGYGEDVGRSSAASSSRWRRGWSSRSVFSVTFPLVFVAGPERRLLLVGARGRRRPRPARVGRASGSAGSGASRSRSRSRPPSRPRAAPPPPRARADGPRARCGGRRRRRRHRLRSCLRLVTAPLSPGCSGSCSRLSLVALAARRARAAWRYLRELA